jgi:hypothetical protein
MRVPEDKLPRATVDVRKRCGSCWTSQGGNAGMVPNWPGLSMNGSGIKASVSAACSLGGRLALQATLAMLGI